MQTFFIYFFFIFLFCNTHYDHKGINYTSTHTLNTFFFMCPGEKMLIFLALT